MKRTKTNSPSYTSYGLGSVNIRCGFRLAKFNIVSANTPFAQANQLPKAINVSQMLWDTVKQETKLTCVRGSVVYVDTLVYQPQRARIEHQLQAAPDLVVVVRRLRLHQQAHGPRILQADVRSYHGTQSAGYVSHPLPLRTNSPPIPLNCLPSKKYGFPPFSNNILLVFRYVASSPATNPISGSASRLG